MSYYTDKQKEQMLDAARKGKTIREICETYNLYMPSVRGFLTDAVSRKIIPPMVKERKRNYHKFPIVPEPILETTKEKEAKLYKGRFDDEVIPVIKLKPLPYKSIFECV